MMDLLKQKPKGMKPNHRHFTRWNHGNGKFHYAPDLTNATNDFFDGALAWNNLKPGNQGLQLLDDGKAEAIFNVFTPYIIVAKIHEIDNPADDTQASRITLTAAQKMDVSLSLDHGKTWHVVDKLPAGEEKTLDLTKWVKGTYGYQLKLATKGKRGDTALNSLQIETWVQVAPISLPRLKKGLNHLRYFMEDRHGKQTEPVLVTPNTGDPADLKKYLTTMPRDYDPQRHTSRIRGEAVLHLPAPPGKKIAWFSVGAAFRTHQGEHAKQTKNRILYAVNQPSDFQEIYDATVPTWVNHWRYNWDTD
ncbi:hypothetical protein GF373_06755, partial [bacterium]|nr:hypothetical protein [bacterium]